VDIPPDGPKYAAADVAGSGDACAGHHSPDSSVPDAELAVGILLPYFMLKSARRGVGSGDNILCHILCPDVLIKWSYYY
jgi:hypothetical protein